jgi:hypothetical protein
MSLIVIRRDQRPGTVVEVEVAQSIIPKSGPTIQTMVFSRGYVASSGALWNERWISLKPFSHTPTNFEKYKGRRSIYFIWFITFRILEPLGPCRDHHFPLAAQPYTICTPFMFISSYREEGMIHTRSYPKEMTDYDIPSNLQWKEMV